MATPTIRTRPPTKQVSPPVILVEGPAGSGRSWLAALLTASPKVGRCFWLELGTGGTADPYGAIPDAEYEIIVHDGTWTDICDQVSAVRAEAQAASDRGDPPVVLIIDTMTAVWEMLCEWAEGRAKAREERRMQRANQARTRSVTDGAGPTIGLDLWNDSRARWRKLMYQLLTINGITVLIAKGGDVVKVVNGKPVEGKRDYKVRGERDLPHDVTALIRLGHDGPPELRKLASVHGGIRPGVDEPLTKKDLSLEWLIFEMMRYDPKTATVRDIVVLQADDADPDDPRITHYRDAVLAVATEVELKELWDDAKGEGLRDAPTAGRDGVPTTLAKLIAARLGEIRDQTTDTPSAAPDLPAPGHPGWHEDQHPVIVDGTVARSPIDRTGACGICEQDAAEAEPGETTPDMPTQEETS